MSLGSALYELVIQYERDYIVSCSCSPYTPHNFSKVCNTTYRNTDNSAVVCCIGDTGGEAWSTTGCFFLEWTGRYHRVNMKGYVGHVYAGIGY